MKGFDVREIREFLEDPDLKNIPAVLSLQGLSGSSVYFPLAGILTESLGKVHVVIRDNSSEASYAAGDLSVLTGDENVFLFPASYRGTGKTARPDESFRVQRTTALRALSRFFSDKKDIILVTYTKALNEGVPEKDALEKNALTVHKGLNLSHEAIKEYLFGAGFEKTDFVTEPGQFAVRGSIIDVFSYSENRPYRINFFGDEIENIRIFDQNSQLSIEERLSVSLTQRLQGEQLLLDTIADHALVWSFSEDFKDIPVNIPVMSFYKLVKETNAVRYETTPQPVFNKNFGLLVSDIRKRKAEGYRVFILSENKAQIRRLEDIFESLGCPQPFVEYKKISLHEGFTDHGNKICYYTDHQLFQRIHRVHLKGSVQKSEQITLNELTGFRWEIMSYILITE